MIFVFPASGGIVERAQQFLPANLTFHDLGEERAALSFTKELIDVAEQNLPAERHGRASVPRYDSTDRSPGGCSVMFAEQENAGESHLL